MNKQALEDSKKAENFSFRWTHERKKRWKALAEELFPDDDHSAVAREVLEEFMSCFTADDELAKLGLLKLTGKRPGNLLSLALARTVGCPTSNVPTQAPVSESPPARRTKSAR